MTQAPTALYARLAPTVMLALCALLGACGGSPSRPETTSPPQSQTTGHSVPRAGADIVAPKLPPSQHAAAFASAEQALATHDWMAAATALAAVQPGQVPDDTAYLTLLQARTHYLRGDVSAADHLLATLPESGLAPAIDVRINAFRALRAREQGRYLHSALLDIERLALTPGAAHETLKGIIWEDLRRLDAAQLESALQQQDALPGSAREYWLSLAALSARHEEPASLALALQNWRDAHAYSANQEPIPASLQAVLDTGGSSPKTVALLLPLGGRLGPAARAVLDGYLAAHYEAGADTEVLTLDTNTFANTTAAYHAAIERGADLVIGPLSKEGVAELAALDSRPIPILSLNRSETTPVPAATALVQMSLSPEDEAIQIAELAWSEGARRALLIRPGGDWGEKMAAALQVRWEALGGQLNTAVSVASAEGYSDRLKQGLDLDDSEQRARELRSMLATNIEFSPRRRQDMDSVFMLAANADQARALKPLLAFHYAGDLPVYATSSVYQGSPSPRDRDLDGLRLVDLPWLLDASADLRAAIAAGGTGSDTYARLNALGADAYFLQQHFARVQAGPPALLHGSTGILRPDKALRIQREAQPATFDGGELSLR